MQNALSLVYANYATREQADISLREVANGLGRPGCCRCLLVAPPNGGKRRIQHAVAKLRGQSQAGFDVFIDLVHLSRSGSADLYRYAARELIKVTGAEGERLKDLEYRLESLDIDGRILWHLERWDDVAEEGRVRVAEAISGLHVYLLSTADARAARPMLEGHSVTPIDGAVCILPFDRDQLADFVTQYCDLDDEASEIRIHCLAAQLPGLASLPGGIEYICENAAKDSIIEVLLGFVNKDQQETGYPVLPLDRIAAYRSGLPDWEATAIKDAFKIIMANVAPGGRSLADTLSRLSVRETAQRIWWVEPDEQKRATQWFDRAVRSRTLLANDDDTATFRFTVPEVGYLLSAIHIDSSLEPLPQLGMAYRKWLENQSDKIARCWLAYAIWRAERFTMMSSIADWVQPNCTS